MNPFTDANPWEWLLMLFGWSLWLLAMAGALIVLFAVLVSIVQGVAKWFPRKSSGLSKERFDAEAAAIARDMIKHDQMSWNAEEIFRQGTTWAWGALHRRGQ